MCYNLVWITRADEDLSLWTRRDHEHNQSIPLLSVVRNPLAGDCDILIRDPCTIYDAVNWSLPETFVVPLLYLCVCVVLLLSKSGMYQSFPFWHHCICITSFSPATLLFRGNWVASQYPPAGSPSPFSFLPSRARGMYQAFSRVCLYPFDSEPPKLWGANNCICTWTLSCGRPTVFP